MTNDEKKGREERQDRGGLPGDTRDGMLSANETSSGVSGASKNPRVRVGADTTPKDVVNQLHEGDAEEKT